MARLRAKSASRHRSGGPPPALWVAKALWRERRLDEALCKFYEAVARPIYRSAIGRWKNYERQFAPALKRLAPLARAFG